MATESSGILSAQQASREAATNARNGRKSVLKKLSIPMILTVAVVITFLFWWRSDGEETVAKMTTAPLTDSSGTSAVRAPETIQVFPPRRINGEKYPEIRSGTIYTMVLGEKPRLLEGREGFCLETVTDEKVQHKVRGVQDSHPWLSKEEFVRRLEADDPSLPFRGVKWSQFASPTGKPVELRYEYHYVPRGGECPMK